MEYCADGFCQIFCGASEDAVCSEGDDFVCYCESVVEVVGGEYHGRAMACWAVIPTVVFWSVSGSVQTLNVMSAYGPESAENG